MLFLFGVRQIFCFVLSVNVKHEKDLEIGNMEVDHPQPAALSHSAPFVSPP